ncbi:hypothetical protein RND81_07G167200 [Saponaria officinalis]|uniref:Protein NRDE2 homolog n=1 Tax=Saponaria officinalis TaxID=3572 RepID=A0AAW1JRR5_SAPOF
MDDPKTKTPEEKPPPSLFPISNSTTTTSADKPPCLFPISASAVAAATPQWLHNTSFTTDISLISAAVSSLHSTEESEPEPKPEPKPKPSYELLESSASDKEEKVDRIQKRKKKKRKKESDYDDDVERFSSYGARKSGVHVWANSEIKPSKDYYFDSKGDPDNLAFGCLYRMDIVRYKHEGGMRLESDLQVYSRLNQKSLLKRGEVDVDGLDAQMRTIGRYCSAKYSALERDKNFKRIRVVAPKKHVPLTLDDFIPLFDEDENDISISGRLVVEESWEDEVLRKTREFNKLTREHPQNVRVWLDFAEFQDKVASRQPQKGARLQTLEKKISILEKAVELNPEDEDLVICLLKAYGNKDSADILIGRWEKVLMQHSGSPKLWREFLHVVKGDFSTFKVSELRKIYAHAIQALSSASSKKHRQGHPAVVSLDHADIDAELGIVDIFLSLCSFEWHAGYHELTTALFQAEIEYCLFCPPLHLTEQSKKRLFEHFWNSNGARVGEDGALGWSTWLEKEEETRQKLLQKASSMEDEQAGWTGWFVPPSQHKENSLKSEEAGGTVLTVEEMEEDKDVDVAKLEEDDASLLRMLGIDADAEANSEVHDPTTWVRWSEVESSKDRDQWKPVRGNRFSQSNEEMEDADEQFSRVIFFEDISDYLFSLSSHEARLSLVLQFIEFFGGEVSRCICTNSSSWIEKLLSLETLPNSISEYIGNINGAGKFESGSCTFSLEFLSQNPHSSARNGIMNFLRNAALLCLKVFPRNYKLEEAILHAEEKAKLEINTLLQTAMPSRALAKNLLKSDRQDVLLCGVYARREAAFGNLDHARKVFDMALSSISGLHSENQTAPMLYLWYAEMELAGGYSSESESNSRAMHILSCLGSGTTYSPYKGRPLSTQLLRAHQGFKEHINAIKSLWAREPVSDSSVALICSAAQYERLTVGWAAGVKVLTDALSMVLPERKRRSYQLEFLYNYHVRMLEKHLEEATMPKLLQSVLLGLQIYPFNPELFRSLVHLSHLHTVPNKLRQIFDNLWQKNPSVILSLFSLSYELSRGGSQHRIHGLFERALTNDKLRLSVLLWRCYIAYEIDMGNISAARRAFFRAIHSCPWSKMLWLDGFRKLNNILSAKELLDLQEVMREKELNLRTDIYEILLQDELTAKP